jgi:hypothetical protein
MKKIILFVIINSLSFPVLSAIGDLYYCEMIQAVELKEERLIKYIPQKFKFRMTENNSIKFGMDENYFKNLELVVEDFSSNGEQFYGESFEYSYGSFYFADVIRWPLEGIDELTATAVNAQCSIVDDFTI